MKKLLAFLLITSLSHISYAAQQNVDKSLDTKSDSTVEINVVRGDVRIHGWNQNKVQVKGQLDENVEDFIFINEKNITTIKVKIPNNTNSGKTSNLDIYIPNKNELNITGVSTDISLNSLQGKIALQLVSGDIQAKALTGQSLKAKTVSGDLTIENNQGDLQAKTVSGDMQINNQGQNLRIKTVSGDINLVNSTAITSLEISSVSGDMRLKFPLAKDGDVSFSTVSGDVNLALQNNINARVDISTGPGGNIINQLTQEKPNSSMVSAENLQLTIGNGKGKIYGKTVSGELIIGK